MILDSIYLSFFWLMGIEDNQSTFIKTTYDISLDSQISLLPLGFSRLLGIVVVAVVKEGEFVIQKPLAITFFDRQPQLSSQLA